MTTALRLARAQSASKTGPIGVVSIIQRHLNLIARLVAGTPRDADAAAAMIGHTGSTYPLTKALQAARRYGPSVASLALLADRAAADVRGASALDNGVIVDILVARVAASRQPRR